MWSRTRARRRFVRCRDVKCWGYNAFGQLGLGDKNNRGRGVANRKAPFDRIAQLWPSPEQIRRAAKFEDVEPSLVEPFESLDACESSPPPELPSTWFE